MSLINLNNFNDAECLEIFNDLIEKRVEVSTAFISNKSDGIIYKECLVVQAGDLVQYSEPQDLNPPLKEVVVEEPISDVL